MSAIPQLKEQLKRAALELGFDLAGVAGVADTPEHRFFPEWIDDGRAGEMKYLEARNEADELKRAVAGECRSLGALGGALRRSTTTPTQPYSSHAGLAVAGLDFTLRLVAARLPRCGTEEIARAGNQADGECCSSVMCRLHAPGATSTPVR